MTSSADRVKLLKLVNESLREYAEHLSIGAPLRCDDFDVEVNFGDTDDTTDNTRTRKDVAGY
jgi:hypothetical protein